MTSLRFTELAEADLAEISAFIAKDNPTAAMRLIDMVEEKCRLIASRPAIGRPRDALLAGLRSHPIGQYIVFYRPIPDGVEIVRVLHGARDVDAAFTEPANQHA